MQAKANEAKDFKGTVQLYECSGVTIHTYISPEDGFLTNTPIIEGRESLVIFDGQLFLPYAREAAAYAESLGKPVERIILSHVHPDHWLGLPVMAERFPDAPIFALAGISQYLLKNGQAILDARRPTFGDKIPPAPTIPDQELPEGLTTIGGISFDFRRFVDAESPLQLVAIMPDQHAILAFDLAFARSEHVFTVAPHFENWMRILDRLNAVPAIEAVVSGHGSIADKAAFAATVDYLQVGKATHSQAKGPEEYADRMKGAFPNRRHPAWIDLAASLLYSTADTYNMSA
jgi:glyoxylase-like metal-dependent hydrolase (beta-lactamase superfamily II)